MPEREVKPEYLKTGAHIAGIGLTVWAAMAAICTLFGRTVVGDMAAQFGFPSVHVAFSVALTVIAIVLAVGHITSALWLVLPYIYPHTLQHKRFELFV
ncbi:hypothetical protein [Mycobacterium sp. M23085]|uniref:hypothetical protein n=1 Tax=Mycobacterium sp. M23085 TaxID=3378087 RepID=UPI003877ED95